MSLTYKKDILDNGVRVVSESSRDARSLALGFYVDVGSSLEPESLSGVSHFIEHILFKGTRKRSAYNIANALESVGGGLDAFAGREATAFVSRCLPEHLHRSVDVLSDMLCNPAMKREAIELEKRVIFEEIRSFDDTPEEVVHEHLARSVWGSRSIASPILGTMESVGSFRRDTVMPYFKSHYVPSKTIVAATGKVDHKKLVDYVSRNLKIREKKNNIQPDPYPDSLPRVFHDTRKVSQCYICLGVEAPCYTDKNRFGAVILSLLLGGGMTSRLFQEVREKLGLAYSVYCMCEFYRETGLFTIFLAVDPKKAKQAVGQVAKELKRLKRRGLRKGELKSIKQQLKGSMVLGLESTSARMNRLARQELYLDSYVPVEKTLKKLMSIREGAIEAEAKRLFDPAKFSLVTVGPSGAGRPTKAALDF
jgi:predicted Zn-dependent peptidase